MLLQQVDFANSLATTVYGERYLNDTKGNFVDYSEVNPWYDPQGDIPAVFLPFTVLPEQEFEVFKTDPSAELIDFAKSQFGGYKFFWHPDVQRSAFQTYGFVSAQPTGSTRTLLTDSGHRVYIKTDLDKKHFRFIRRLKRDSVEHSVLICEDLRRLMANRDPGVHRYAFLPESLGLVVKSGTHAGSGMIYRESRPYPYVNDRRVMVPYHALYASDPKEPSHLPLLVQLVHRNGGNDPIGYFVSGIVGPVLESWVLLAAQCGILAELHGQNALAEIDENFSLRRCVHRDFQGAYTDVAVRAQLGLPQFKKHRAGEESGTTIESQYSHIFDGMVGRYLLSRMTKAFCTHFSYEYSIVSAEVAEYFRSIPGSAIGALPATTYRFGNTAQQQIGNDVVFADTGEKPEFR